MEARHVFRPGQGQNMAQKWQGKYIILRQDIINPILTLEAFPQCENAITFGGLYQWACNFSSSQVCYPIYTAAYSVIDKGDAFKSFPWQQIECSLLEVKIKSYLKLSWASENSIINTYYVCVENYDFITRMLIYVPMGTYDTYPIRWTP